MKLYRVRIEFKNMQDRMVKNIFCIADTIDKANAKVDKWLHKHRAAEMTIVKREQPEQIFETTMEDSYWSFIG